ncbi:putative (S)-N-methylcoclaurine 3'-hydroxylase isozyme 2 [Bidens hawaiensis]|uniref:putative (S)-N-methylcoclaurine 3'-hydroxylase isozyme 2 n=1 Tax=Bidens hawaiensis TaxID=980011 RepID=UPI00404AEF5E
MKKVQEELVKIVGLNNMVEESHLPKLQYLDATIKETLRIYPIAPLLIPRSPSKACIAGGYTIPKGCTIFLNVWSIQRDSRYWDDPLEFNPERFLANKCDYKGNKLMFFPFGSGRRLCPGYFSARLLILCANWLLTVEDFEMQWPKLLNAPLEVVDPDIADVIELEKSSSMEVSFAALETDVVGFVVALFPVILGLRLVALVAAGWHVAATFLAFVLAFFAFLAIVVVVAEV